MSFHQGDRLFREFPLENYLRAISESMEDAIEHLRFDEIEGREDVLAEELAAKYKPIIPEIFEDQMKLDIQEAKVTLSGGDSRFDYDDGPVTVNGLSVTVEIPFKGDSRLFQCMPSTYTVSGTPEANLRDSQLILNYETTEKKDHDKIKSLWMGDIKTIKDYLSWIERDMARFNDSIKNNIMAALRRRKKEASDTQELINKLKQ